MRNEGIERKRLILRFVSYLIFAGMLSIDYRVCSPLEALLLKDLSESQLYKIVLIALVI
jgi:hypothetical protein